VNQKSVLGLVPVHPHHSYIFHVCEHDEGPNPLHQFPRSKSVTSWRQPRNKSAT